MRPLLDPVARGHVPLPMVQLKPGAPGREDGGNGREGDGARVVPAQGVVDHFWPRAW